MNLSVENLIILLIVGGLVGVIAQKLAGYSRGGCFDLAIGFIGALIGSWAVKQFRLPEIYVLTNGIEMIAAQRIRRPSNSKPGRVIKNDLVEYLKSL